MTNFQTLVIGLVGLAGLAFAIVGVIIFSRRDRAALIKRMRVGVFIERDLLKPEEIPEWPKPESDITLHPEDPTEEIKPKK